MQWLPWLGVAVSFTLVALIHHYSGTSHSLRKALFSMLAGPALLFMLNAFSGITASALPVSRLSLGIAALLGIPGVILMLMLQLLL